MVKYISPAGWNLLESVWTDDEVTVIAEEDDLVFEIGGILFLVQSKNGFNNIICNRITKSKMTFQEVIKVFRQVMIDQQIQYIRVEGSKKRYTFLMKMLPKIFDNEVAILQSDEFENRNVFYIKCY